MVESFLGTAFMDYRLSARSTENVHSVKYYIVFLELKIPPLHEYIHIVYHRNAYVLQIYVMSDLSHLV